MDGLSTTYDFRGGTDTYFPENELERCLEITKSVRTDSLSYWCSVACLWSHGWSDLNSAWTSPGILYRGNFKVDLDRTAAGGSFARKAAQRLQAGLRQPIQGPTPYFLPEWWDTSWRQTRCPLVPLLRRPRSTQKPWGNRGKPTIPKTHYDVGEQRNCVLRVSHSHDRLYMFFFFKGEGGGGKRNWTEAGLKAYVICNCFQTPKVCKVEAGFEAGRWASSQFLGGFFINGSEIV